jgi:serine/threonine-protein phosphatase 2A activator
MLDDISSVGPDYLNSRLSCSVISQVKTWSKVNTGMIKMYLAEVLGKLPVIQHFLFGSILPYSGPPPPLQTRNTLDPNDPHFGHAHAMAGPEQPGGWGDCCGIPIPSAFGAKAAADLQGKPGMMLSGANIRPVPFD